MVECRHLKLSDVVQLYTELTDDQDPTIDFNALEQAVIRPREGFEGYDLYPELDHKAAALFEEIIRARPFPTRNGMVAALAVYTFYGLNGRELAITDAELVELGEWVQEGRAGTTAEIAVRFGRFASHMDEPPVD